MMRHILLAGIMLEAEALVGSVAAQPAARPAATDSTQRLKIFPFALRYGVQSAGLAFRIVESGCWRRSGRLSGSLHHSHNATSFNKSLQQPSVPQQVCTIGLQTRSREPCDVPRRQRDWEMGKCSSSFGRRTMVGKSHFTIGFVSSALLVGLSMAAPAMATATPYDRLYVFGDSYSDTGAGYVDTNGPTAVAYLARDLGIPFTYAGDPNATRNESLNFAVSGASTGSGTGTRIDGALLGYGMMNQVQDFTNLVHAGSVSFNPATTLFFLEGGLNDSSLPTSTVLANLTGEAEQLYALGARHFEVTLLPAQVPAFGAVATRLNPAYQNQLLPALQADLVGAEVRLSNWGPFYDDIILNPSKYGFTNVTDLCAGRAIFGEDTTPCATPDTYFYYHASHPSTDAHRVVGDELYQEILAQTQPVPEPETMVLFASSLASLAFLRRSRRKD